MRKELVDSGNEIMLNLMERKLRQLARRANSQVTASNALPSGCITRIADTKLLMKHIIAELITLSDTIDAIAKEVMDDDEE